MSLLQFTPPTKLGDTAPAPDPHRISRMELIEDLQLLLLERPIIFRLLAKFAHDAAAPIRAEISAARRKST